MVETTLITCNYKTKSISYVNIIKFDWFNLKSTTARGNSNEANDNDNPNYYTFDCTIVYDRWSTPSIFAIWQYGGREYEMYSDRCESLLPAIYETDSTSKYLRAFICPSASN
ncbi:unnamed protein product [Rotaria sp. Silwood1]|nr:unnamed protein product [Rotaria sp. Silwood1]